MTESASALVWLPPLVEAGLPVPRTEIVPYDHLHIIAMLEDFALEDEGEQWHRVVMKAREAAERIGYPVFIRNDLTSAKHEGPRAYRASEPADVARVLSENAEDAEMKLWPAGPFPEAFLVREWLDLEAPFRAFGGHPIAREWRFFVRRDESGCAHFYWTHDAIRDADDPEWERRLEELSGATAEIMNVVHPLARRAKRALDAVVPRGEWSIDFAKDTSGKWWLIDAAPADQSWHPEHTS